MVVGISLEVLAPAECVRLLAAERIGRIGITVNALPVIMPVRYVLDGDEILFRATRGGALDAGTCHTVIAFEADGIEPGVGAWSVMATGMARHLAEDDGRDEISLPAWSSDSDLLVALTPQLISGRRLTERL